MLHQLGPEPRPKVDLMHILGQKEATWNTISVFLSDGGAPKRRGAWENFASSPLSTGLSKPTCQSCHVQHGRPVEELVSQSTSVEVARAHADELHARFSGSVLL